MKKAFLLFILFLGFQFVIYANPIDDTPITYISELVFDSNNNWTMELYFPFGYDENRIDSIKIKISGIESKINIHPVNATNIYIITKDSLSNLIEMNREGDRIEVYTYSHLNSNYFERLNFLIYGDNSSAMVGKPVNGYSIYGVGSFYILTKNPSIGFMNNYEGRSAILTGYIYDSQNRIVTKIKSFYYFFLETAFHFNADSTYIVKIFRKFTNQTISYLNVYMYDSWVDSNKIVPFELNNIHPDTTVVQNIHLMKDDYVITSVKNEIIPKDYKVTLINYPNPFNLTTYFFVKLPYNLKGKPGTVKIYNVTGQLIKSLAYKDGKTVRWDSANRNGMPMPSGIYYYQLSIENKILKTGSMILLK